MRKPNPLRALLVRHGYTLDTMARDSGVRFGALVDASRGKTPLTDQDRAAIAYLLNIPPQDVPALGHVTIHDSGSAGAAAVGTRD